MTNIIPLKGFFSPLLAVLVCGLVQYLVFQIRELIFAGNMLR